MANPKKSPHSKCQISAMAVGSIGADSRVRSLSSKVKDFVCVCLPAMWFLEEEQCALPLPPSCRKTIVNWVATTVNTKRSLEVFFFFWTRKPCTSNDVKPYAFYCLNYAYSRIEINLIQKSFTKLHYTKMELSFSPRCSRPESLNSISLRTKLWQTPRTKKKNEDDEISA